LGYVFQGQWALLELIRGSALKPDCRLSLELFDDVAWDSSGTPVELLQIKHHTQSNRSLSDIDADLWRTVGAWLDAGPPADAEGPLLTLVTTQRAADKSAISHLRPPTPEVDVAMRLLEDAARKSAATGTEAHRRRFLALTEAERRLFLSRIRLLDAVPAASDLDAVIRVELRFSLPPGFADQAMQRLWGWWHMQVLEMLQRRKSSVGAVELHLFLDDMRSGYASDNLPTYDELKLKEEDVGAFAEHVFVHQLRWVLAPEQILRTAILDYYRAYSHTAQWLKEDLVGLHELERFEASLKDEWDRAFAWVVKELPDDADDGAKERVGRELLQRALGQTAVRVRDRYGDPFFSRGKHHDLADHGKIGWHPEFEAKLKALLLSKTA
jgi:hypothetical protein